MVGLLQRLRRARLASRVLKRLRRAGLADSHYDARTFQIRFVTPSEAAPSEAAPSEAAPGEVAPGEVAPGDGNVPTIIELAPLLATPGRRRLDEYVAGLLLTPELPHSWSEVKPLLRPVLRGATPGSPLRRPVLPYLSEFVVVDQPDTMTYTSAAQLAAWNVTADQVFAAARANLTGAVLQGRATEPVIVQFVDDGDAYWTSHLLLPHWLERLADQVGGVPVAFAPERGTLLVTADGSEHLPGLFARAEQIYTTSSRPITPMAYLSDENGCPKPYAAPEGHRLHRAVQRAERVLALHEYARQAAHISNAAALRLTGDELSGWRTQALWPKDGPTLLPTADEVQTGTAVHPWRSLAPHLTRAPDLDPPRWEATRWPMDNGRDTSDPAS
ncbi:MAG TPA: hypothetical protein VGM93_00515 [Acidimicrobiales bacterium]